MLSFSRIQTYKKILRTSGKHHARLAKTEKQVGKVVSIRTIYLMNAYYGLTIYYYHARIYFLFAYSMRRICCNRGSKYKDPKMITGKTDTIYFGVNYNKSYVSSCDLSCTLNEGYIYKILYGVR